MGKKTRTLVCLEDVSVLEINVLFDDIRSLFAFGKIYVLSILMNSLDRFGSSNNYSFFYK